MMWLRDPRRRWLRLPWLALGLGLLGGSFEAVQVTATLRLSLGFGEALLLAALCSVAGMLVALPAGLVGGLGVQLFGKRWIDSVAYARGMGVTAFLLSGFYLWHAAGNLWEQERAAATLAMALCPIGVAGVVQLNAGYWLRREEIGAESRFGWNLFALFVSLLIGLGCAWTVRAQDYGSAKALSGDPNVLLVTVDTLRRDHVSLYGESPSQTPNIDALGDGEGAIVFLDAVTPTPETGPAHASIFTSLHPLRHGVLSNADTLTRGHTTLAERLAEEGYATGAFVSSFAVAGRTGLGQGFEIYDDDFIPGARGSSQILLAQYALRGLLVSGQGHRMPWLLERDGALTVDQAGRWIDERGERPWFVWVHLFEPHAPYEAESATVDHRALLAEGDRTWTEAEAAELRRVYALEVERADALVGELMAHVDPERTLVVLTADHGESLGEHDIWFQHHGLYDEVVRVPLIVRAPGLRSQVEFRIPHQVRLMDIAPTVLKYIKLDPFEPAEGVELLGYGQRTRKQSLVCDLFGRTTSALDSGCLHGLRSVSRAHDASGEEAGPELRVKYIYDVDADRSELFNLVEDPAEQRNIAASQPAAVEASHQRVSPGLSSAGTCGDADRTWERLGLEALGYQ